MDLSRYRYVVVGAGFYGATVAERIAEALGAEVLVIERRGHIGGNSYSEVDAETGIEYHKYGSHIFHTASDRVWAYVNRFASFTHYRHRVFTTHAGRVYPFPINLSTINAFFGVNLRPGEVDAFLRDKDEIVPMAAPRNFYEKAVSAIGRSLYEAFIEGYTAKQWQADPTTLPPGLFDRLIVRRNYQSDYFSDPHQGVPRNGYGALFRALLAHPRITLRLDTDFFDLEPHLGEGALVVYSGPIDRYFDYRHGPLGWRTLEFKRRVYDVEDYQGTTVMNQADAAVPFTRTHEFRHYHPERAYGKKTLVFEEYSRPVNGAEAPYYPTDSDRDRQLIARYRADARTRPDVIFGGRLGAYHYLNMDEAVDAALDTFETRIRCRRN